MMEGELERETSLSGCRFCRLASLIMGKKFFMPVFGRVYAKIATEEIKSVLVGLDLDIVGGLARRGFTRNDIDVVGKRSDIPILVQRLEARNIDNPVHYCGSRDRHSHAVCIYYGIKIVFTGRGY